MKKRLDVLVAEKEGISREKAQKLIMAGLILVDEKIVDKVGIQIDEYLPIFVKETFPYVSRGALKLKKAYEEFGLDFRSKIIADIGASTGGFTDFALQNGADKVYAIDTGKGQIDQKLREDDRVVLMENTNIKSVEKLPEKVDFFVVDVSFISLKQVLPQCRTIENSAAVIALIKPQFEVGKEIADKTKGIIRDPLIRKKVVAEIQNFSKKIGYTVKKTTVSPITGAKGNVEYLIYLTS